MPYLELRRNLATSIQKQFTLTKLEIAEVESELGTPPNIELGHVAWPCFRLGKALKTSPAKIAAEFASQFKEAGVTATPAGPYVNFRWDSQTLFQTVLTSILKEKERYGHGRQGVGKSISLEYCSPNIAKPLFFHHIRSTLIGNVLANIYEALGYQTERINFVGDWGAQFARLVAAFELWGRPELLTLSNVPESMKHLLEIYVRFHKELETHPEYADRANECLQRLEKKEPKTTELWSKVREISLKSMESTLSRLAVHFKHVEGESEYVSHIEPVLEEVKKKANARVSEGAWIVEVPGIETPALIQKKDGTTLYLTRDIAAAKDRYQRFQFHKSYYVVSEQQRLHFQQLFGVLKMMGFDWAEKCEHLSFGTVLFNGDRMSTREGRAIYLDEVLNEAQKLALAQCSEKNPDLVNKEAVAEMVGIGAVIFGELSSHKQRDINFDWKHVLAFDGETGPYVQYSLVRCFSILEKAQGKADLETVPSNIGYVFSQEEDQLALTLSKFQSVLEQSVGDNEPFHLTRYLIEVAKHFNRFYYKFPVLQVTDEETRRLRLLLVKATEVTLQNGLKLLGIQCPREM